VSEVPLATMKKSVMSLTPARSSATTSVALRSRQAAAMARAMGSLWRGRGTAGAALGVLRELVIGAV
jgi:hypothetical protein